MQCRGTALVHHAYNMLGPDNDLVMNGVILGYDDDGDHVPELGVKGVHEHVQPL